MRPVNLTPPEDRRDARAPLRAGSLSYLVVAGLALAVAGVTALVLTGNSISDRETQISELEAQEAAATAEAESLKGFAEFATMSETRALTVTSLAQSRFDWERVLNELALVIPDDVWLVELSGAASPEVQVENGAEVSLSSELAGPSLSLIGCADGHEAVARFLQALKDIDGVTRVGIAKSQRSADAEAGTGSVSSDCRTRDFISRFEVVAAFDEAVVPVAAAGAAPTTPAPTTAPEATPTAADGAGVAETQAEEERVRDSAAEKTDSSQEAVSNFVPGVAR